MILGRTKINPYVWLFNIFMIVTPLFCYYMATIKQKKAKPFPHSTVTTTACYYPQDIAFRFFMLIAASFLSLMFYMICRWVNYQCKRVAYEGKYSTFAFFLCQFSILCYCVTIGTIDQKGIGKLHGPCAVTFFLIWIITVSWTTYFLSKLRNYDSSVMSASSLLFKKIVVVYLLLIWIYCIVNIIMENQQESNKQDIYVVILQWNTVYGVIFWSLSWVQQWKKIGLCLWKKS